VSVVHYKQRAGNARRGGAEAAAAGRPRQAPYCIDNQVGRYFRRVWLKAFDQVVSEKAPA